MRGDPQGRGKVPASCSETSFPFLSAITDGIPEPSEGTVHVALKLERMDGVDLVSQRPPEESFQVLPYRGVCTVHMEWLVPLSPNRQEALS